MGKGISIVVDRLINRVIRKVKAGCTARVQYSQRALVLHPENGHVIGSIEDELGTLHHLGLDEAEVRSIMVNAIETPEVTYEEVA